MARTTPIDKIRKLLRRAADPANPHEAAMAASMAQALLYKHKLELRNCSELEDATAGVVEMDRPFIHEQWRQILAAVCARNNFGRVLAWPGGFKFIGQPDDLQVILSLYTFLSRTIARLAREGWAAHEADLTDPVLGRHPALDEPGTAEAWRESFRMGAVEIVGVRMEQTRTQSDAEAAFASKAVVGPEKGALVRRVTALQKIDQALDKYITDKFGAVRPMENTAFNLRLDGFARGVIAGKALPIAPDRRRLT